MTIRNNGKRRRSRERPAEKDENWLRLTNEEKIWEMKLELVLLPRSPRVVK